MLVTDCHVCACSEKHFPLCKIPMRSISSQNYQWNNRLLLQGLTSLARTHEVHFDRTHEVHFWGEAYP